MDIAAWLRELGLERYEEAFRENEIDAKILPKLTADDLKELGVTTVGHRRKLLEAIAALANPGLASRAEPSTPAAAAPRLRRAEAERRQLTVLFCDLVESTELSARIDPEDMREVMRHYQAACADVVRRFEGHVARFLGDGMLAYFGWPRAHEDEAERAVRAGLQLVQNIARLELNADVTLQARVGVATGHVVVGDLIGKGISDRDAVSGDTPNLAARLQVLAVPGSVVVSASTRRLLGGLFELADLGPQRLKGFAEPVPVWQVTGERRVEGRFEALRGEHLSPLVGREHELAILLERWAWAKSSHGQVVLIGGEPGIGKSRVIRALRERLGDEPYTPFSHYCSPYHTNSALYPVIDLLERAARLDCEAPPEAQLIKLEALLEQSSAELAQVVPLFAALLKVPTGERYPALSLTPKLQKRLMQALVDQVVGLSARQPVLALYEDVHWIDPSTLELLGLVIERVRQLPVLALITFRPEFQPPWTGHAHLTTLTMSRLDRRQGADLVARVAGDKPLPAEVVEQIVRRTDGVPLFVEELTKTVLESCLLRDAVARYGLAAPLPAVAIPSTLQDSLLARLDRVAPAKEIAQIGAVIGQEFPYALLAAVAGQPEAHLRAALDHLVASELVFCRGAPPEVTYCFKHALVHDAAYGTLLNSRRQELHVRIAKVLEEQFPETAKTQPELLARHCTHAGLIEKAVNYWYWAGRQAMARSTLVEAAALLTQGLDLLAGLPRVRGRDDQEFDLLIALGAPLIAIKGLAAPEVERVKTRARELKPEEHPDRQLLGALYGLCRHHLDRSSNEVFFNIAEKLLRLAVEQKDDEWQFVGHHCLGLSFFSNGKFAPALKHFETSLTQRAHLASRARPEIRVACLLFKALTLLVQGYPDKASEARDDGLAAARRLGGDLRREGLYLAGWYHHVTREPQDVKELASELNDLERKHGEVNGAILHGWAEGVDGAAELLEGVEAIKDSGVQRYTPGFLGLLAELYIELKDFDEALRRLEQALAQVGRLEERWFEAELRRLKGEALLGLPQDPSADAEKCFHAALTLARDQRAHLWEVRAANSLARLWRDQGKYAEAYEVLAPVYDWFTEGFDTADLKDAEALLEELR